MEQQNWNFFFMLVISRNSAGKDDASSTVTYPNALISTSLPRPFCLFVNGCFDHLQSLKLYHLNGCFRAHWFDPGLMDCLKLALDFPQYV